MSAIFGLVGVVVGVALTFALTYALERRREKRTVRAAARLVQQEFVEGMVNAAYVGVFAANASVDRPIVVEERAWLEHRTKLAEALSGSEWSELTWAAKHRREFVDWIDQRTAGDKPLVANDLTRVNVSNFHHWGNRGFDALNVAAGIPRKKREELKREREREAADREE